MPALERLVEDLVRLFVGVIRLGELDSGVVTLALQLAGDVLRVALRHRMAAELPARSALECGLNVGTR